MTQADIKALAEDVVDTLDYDDAEDLLTILQSEDDSERSLFADALNEALEAIAK